MTQEILEKTFPVPLPARLRVSNIRGSVEILASEPSEGQEAVISITAIKDASSGSAEYTLIQIEQDDQGNVSAVTTFQKGSGLAFFFGLNTPCRVDYRITAPRQCSVSVECVSSRASLEGLQGQITIKSVSGDLEMRLLAGSLRVNTVSGRLEGEAWQGQASVESVSGDVRLRQSNLDKINLKTVSGKMLVETPLGPGPYNFESVSGRLTLTLPEQTACSVDFRSLSGRFSCDLPAARRLAGSHQTQLQIGSGGASVRFHSQSGDLHLQAADQAQPESGFESEKEGTALPADEPAATNSPSQILEQIERGEITVEQALQRLHEL